MNLLKLNGGGLSSYVCGWTVDLCILSEDTNDVRGYRVAVRCPQGGNSHDCFDYNNCALHVWFDTRQQAANEFCVVLLNRVPTSATASDIKKAYYKLSLK
jgi:hypothetical protein